MRCEGITVRGDFSPKLDSHSGQRVFIIEVSRWHSDTRHSVGLFRTGDQPVAETSTRKHTTLTRNRHSFSRRDSNPQCRQASGYKDRQMGTLY